ncbi:MAG: heme exporter protein CcmD [Formivibrio sp.]|nr:heme exporter protein CcmD [Formivibrio sp.]
MTWQSPAEFFAMGGYGFYVWGSFGLTALCILIEPLMARHRHQEILQELRREVAADMEDEKPAATLND